jgi:hypothetical protein
MLYLHPKPRVVYPVSPVCCLTLQLDVSGWAHTTSRDDWQILNVHEMAAANKQCDCVQLSYSGQAVEDRTPHFWQWILLWERVLSWPRTPAHDLTWFFTNRNDESNPNCNHEKSEVRDITLPKIQIMSRGLRFSGCYFTAIWVNVEFFLKKTTTLELTIVLTWILLGVLP